MAKVPDTTPAPILLLCDWAQAINGKLYMQGAGIDRVVAGPIFPLAIAIVIYVGWNDLNQPHRVGLQLQRDGEPYPVGNPLQAEWSFELGRPPGIAHGSVLSAPLSLHIPAIQFDPGRYDLKLSINNEPRASLTFEAIGGPLP
jgi:hypothetical protein